MIYRGKEQQNAKRKNPNVTTSKSMEDEMPILQEKLTNLYLINNPKKTRDFSPYFKSLEMYKTSFYFINRIEHAHIRLQWYKDSCLEFPTIHATTTTQICLVSYHKWVKVEDETRISTTEFN